MSYHNLKAIILIGFFVQKFSFVIFNHQRNLCITKLNILISDESQTMLLPKNLLLSGPVATGYGRGSKKLGVPTANLPYFDESIEKYGYKRGVYFGWGKVEGDDRICPLVANIGLSPTFSGQENPLKIVEAHLIGRSNREDFYGRRLNIALVAFLRAERKFDTFDELVANIKNDIGVATRLHSFSLGGVTEADVPIKHKFHRGRWDLEIYFLAVLF